MEFVGEYLKQQREKKGVDLVSVCKELNISLSYLKAIEDDDFLKTPGGVYTLGFIKSYSDYLNLDSKKIIINYKNQISDKNTDQDIQLPKPIKDFSSYNKIISFSLASIISVVFYFMFISNSNIKPDFAITPDLSEEMMASIEEYEVKTALSKDKETQNEKLITKSFISKDNIISNNQSSAIASSSEENFSDSINQYISLQALDLTWIQIRNSENEIVYSKLMNAKDKYKYLFKDQYSITTGNAGNIIVLFGEEVKGKLGKKGEVLDSIIISSDFFSN